MLSGLFSWISDTINSIFSSKNREVYESQSTTNAINEIIGTSGKDSITIDGYMHANERGTNRVDLGDGNDTLTIKGLMQSESLNQVLLGEGNNSMSVRGVSALQGGSNKISAGDGNDRLTITAKVTNDGGVNEFSLGDGNNTVTMGGMSATDSGNNKIITGDGRDVISMVGSVSAVGTGSQNHIDTGSGNDVVTVTGTLTADGLNAINEFNLGNGNNTMTVTGSIYARNEGVNSITGLEGRDVVTITGRLQSEGNSGSVIDLGDGNNVLTVTGGLYSQDELAANAVSVGACNDVLTFGRLEAYGTNLVDAGAGDDRITVSLGMNAYENGTNSILSGDGDDCVSINGMKTADDGLNLVNTGAGNDHVTISGTVSAADNGTNQLDTGAGDDLICICGKVGEGALSIDAGAGYDKLVLSASNSSTFDANFKDWLSGLDEGNEFLRGVEAIQINLNKPVQGSDINWLADMADDHNIRLELNVDKGGRNIYLDDLFTKDGEESFFSIDMSGSRTNTLHVKGTLESNGVDSEMLHIQGDSRDSVKLSSEWTASADHYTDTASGIVYDVYTNSEHESLLVQEGIKVSFA